MKRSVLRLPNPMIFVLALAFLIPGGLFQGGLERAFAAGVSLLAALVLFAKPSPWEARRVSRQAAWFFFLIQVFFIASCAYSVAFNGLVMDTRGYFEWARYLLLGLFVIYVQRHYDDGVRRATEAVIVAGPYLALLAGAFYLRHSDAKSFANHFQTLRLAAPFGSPDFLGFYMVEALTYLIFFLRSPRRLLHAAAALAVIYLTGGRAAWGATALVLAAALAGYSYLGMKRWRLKFALQAGLGVFFVLLAGLRYSERILQGTRAQTISGAARDSGLQSHGNESGRLEEGPTVWNYFKRSPVFGWGPSNDAIFTYVDNQYALWLLGNGIAGALLIITGLGLASWRLVWSRRGDAWSCAGAGAFVAGIAVALWSGGFLDNFRLFYLTWFIGTAIARGGARRA